jgi:hypothetical protein
MPVSTWVIDAANVTGARPDGWWRDRPGAAARLHARVRQLLRTPGWPAFAADPVERPREVVLVLEGAARGGVAAGAHGADAAPGEDATESSPGLVAAGPERALTVVHAPGAGDDAIVATALAAEPPVLVWTSDRGLRARLVATGVQVRGAGGLWALLDRVQPPRGPGSPP